MAEPLRAKKILLTILVLLLLTAAAFVFQLRSDGLLRSPQYDEVAP